MKKKYLLPILFILFFIACKELKNLQNMMNVQNPDVQFESAKLNGLSFEKADLMFDLKVINPNNFNITLSGFDYDLLINQNSFLSGKQNKGLAIKANDFSIVHIPLSIKYIELYDTYKSFKNDDTLKYTLKTGLIFDLPVLGKVRVPVSKSGALPLLKLPSISFKSIKLNNLGLSGADLTVEVGLDNPNAMNILLNKMNYDFNVNGRQWASGAAVQKIKVREKGKSTIKIPVKLDFLQMGAAAYQLLQGNSDLNIEFKGNADMSSSLELLKKFDISFDENKSVKLTK